MAVYILGIESSCDDTSAAVLKGNIIHSNIIANQLVHKNFGGVVPELASRAHLQNIIPVVESALTTANITKYDIQALAFTRGPGLLGSLLVGISFAKAFTQALGIPLIEVDHMQAHVLSHFIRKENETKKVPSFPFLCLTVSGGHTQIVRVDDYFEMKVIGQTIDDAAGEAFDKAAKIMGLPYPGGPVIDKLASIGDPGRFKFSKPNISGHDYSFSGLKTSFLYFLRDQLKLNPDFIESNKADLAASIQAVIIEILAEKLIKASEHTGIKEVAIAGGVSANSGLRNKMLELQETRNWNVYLPEFQYSTDNAAMIAVAGYYKYLMKEFASLDVAPYSRIGNKAGI
ncbi:MAG: tRNA (adenosine(37)-N6)-threonylcarbamoyltransferase complex transferase subunit TsaD [Bacteroidales bacterium]|jgi:N6-L-threonylcarbamoyladenine synthase|nr:tRNA (adenosine(37)-N6)-threonylcarbamoyltransferase complex transferase subunit TsaD [Bacteroidales bacterium]